MEKITKKEFIKTLQNNKSGLLYGGYRTEDISQNKTLMDIMRNADAVLDRTVCKATDRELVFEKNGEPSHLCISLKGTQFSYWKLDEHNIFVKGYTPEQKGKFGELIRESYMFCFYRI